MLLYLKLPFLNAQDSDHSNIHEGVDSIDDKLNRETHGNNFFLNFQGSKPTKKICNCLLWYTGYKSILLILTDIYNTQKNAIYPIKL